MKKEDLPILNQLVQSLEENFIELEKAHSKKDYQTFSFAKKVIVDIQRKIGEITS